MSRHGVTIEAAESSSQSSAYSPAKHDERYPSVGKAQDKEDLATNMRRYAESCEAREARLAALWGPEPEYETQAEDTASLLMGRFFYSWIGDFMYRAAKEGVESGDLPRPTRAHRAYNVGRELSQEMQRQRLCEHAWDSLCGSGSVRVRYVGRPPRSLFRRVRDLLLRPCFGAKTEAYESCVPLGTTGTLRWVGNPQQYQRLRQRFVGVEWDGAEAWPEAQTTIPVAEVEVTAHPRPQPGELHSGTVGGERLFRTASGKRTATCEPVESIVFVSAVPSSTPPLSSTPPPRGMSVAFGVLHALGRFLWSAWPYRLARDSCTVLLPLVLKFFVEFIEKVSREGKPAWAYGFFLVFLMLLLSVVQNVASNKYFHIAFQSAYTYRSALSGLVFEKCMSIANRALAMPAVNTGRITNMISNDCEKVYLFCLWVWTMLGALVQLIAAIVMLCFLLGPAVFVGLLILLLSTPAQYFITRMLFSAFDEKAEATDARLKATNEFISGIRVTKFMSWEPSFIISIERKRRFELEKLKKIQYLLTLSGLVDSGLPNLAIAVMLLVYSMQGHAVTAATVFPTISLLNVLSMPFFCIPVFISACTQYLVSTNRITRFVECPDTDSHIAELMDDLNGTVDGGEGGEQGEVARDPDHPGREEADAYLRRRCAAVFEAAGLSAYVAEPLPMFETAAERAAKEKKTAKKAKKKAKAKKKDSDSKPSAEDDDGTMYQLRLKVLLRDVNVRIPRGKLTFILGPTGSGKSTLLDSLVGAVDVTSGRVLATRSVAYVPQQAWIMNATLRENVLFFSDEDPARLARALDCSQLRADLSLLADGLETEIGEKGINLSGGQKARVGLARAVYADKELYLLDDPLSALDAHVGERVMRECVLGELAGKTRVLATHQVQVVDQADMVVLVEDGRVVFSGTPEEFHQKGLSVGERGEPMSSTNHRQDAHELHDGQAAQEDESTAKSSEKEGTPDSLPVDDVDRLSKSPSTATGPIRSSSLGEKDGAVDTALPSTRDATDTAAAVPVAGPTERGRLLSDEEMASGAVSRAAYTRYIEACGGWCTSISILVLYAVTELVVAGPYLWLSFWSTDAFGLTTNRYLVVYALLTLGDVLCSPARYLSITTAGRRAGRALHSRLLRSVACGTLQFFDTTPTGRIINRFSKDMEQLDDDLPGDISFFLSSAASVLSVVVILVSSQYLVLLLLLPLAFVYLHLMRFYNAANRHLQRITNVSHSAIFSVLGETLSGRWTIEAYGKGHAVMAKALRSLDTIYASAFMMTVGNKWLSVRIESMTAVVTATVGGLGVVACHLPWLMGSRVGMLALSLLMARRLNWVLNSMIMQVASVEADMNAVERISAYVDAIDQEAGTLTSLEKEIAVQLKRPKVTRVTSSSSSPFPAAPTSDPMPGSREDDMGDGGENAPLLRDGEENRPAEASVAIDVAAAPVPQEASTSTDTAARLPDEDAIHRSSTAGSLELRHVDMRYRPGLPLVLRDVSFAIAPRQKVGVVGRTGSGKSTLLLAFLRLVEVCGGELVVCGRPAHEYDVRSLRRLFSMIPQDPLLFDGTVRSNVDPFGEASDAECWAALGHVGMAVRVRGEAGGLDGRVAEGGANFSVGQRQLLCLARALLKRGSAFLLMDEATANVDPALDRQIQQTVARTFRGYTVITIAHRLHTVAGYDVIVMMDGGRVVACGSPRALVSDAASPFAELVRSMGEEAQRKFVASVK